MTRLIAVVLSASLIGTMGVMLRSLFKNPEEVDDDG